MTLPAISFALPLTSEPRWSDMLAVLAATDPLPLCGLLGIKEPHLQLQVCREVAVDAENQPDIVIERGGQRLAVIEVKVLAGLGLNQLQRYVDAVPDAHVYAVIYPQRLVIDVAGAPPWRGVTWEDLLQAYCRSEHQWVAACAKAWLQHLESALPKVDAGTIWNVLIDDEDFIIAMRARMSWLHGQLNPPAPIQHDLVCSTSGVSWVARLYTDTPAPDYEIVTEVEEKLPVRNFPKYANRDWRQPQGPSIKVCLAQRNVKTSAGFDWDYLLRMWQVMQEARQDWVTNPARPKAPHDVAGYRRMVANGGPPYLGIGFGERQTKYTRTCMFGARIQLPPDTTLGHLAAFVDDLYPLIADMARVSPPERAVP
ncbi:hypothetical protein [Plantactinospora sp. CA-290183]|uniref:hypothetical protein n=1 Tax=Plantactinospora sp. CA-290183 TaxID=3240006 RepID=UPI003D8EC6EF